MCYKSTVHTIGVNLVPYGSSRLITQLTWRNRRLPSPPQINSSVRPSVRESVCRYGNTVISPYVKKFEVEVHIVYKLVLQTPNLMNSARLQKVFQNFVVPWKIHKSNSIIRQVLTRHVELCKSCLCKFLQRVGQKHG